MNRPSFNVLTEPWIPVIGLDGSRDEMGILPCLAQAHELREIRDPSPIIEFGIYRLLVAFVLDALTLADRRPESPLDLKEIIGSGCFDPRFFEYYSEHCGDVFDLFHPEKPFLQTKMDGGKSKPIAGMFPAVPSGTNVSHWNHNLENSLRVPVREAIRLLTTIAPFMTAGGAGLSPSINGAPAIYALPVGKNLFVTIVLNIPLDLDLDSGDGVVAWRSKRSPGSERTQATTLEALTWRPRRIQLIPETGDDGTVYVREMKFEKGDSTHMHWRDASLAYRYDGDKVRPIRMRENRTLWQDAGPLLLLNESEHGRGESKVAFRRPDVVNHAFDISDGEEPYDIQVYGMRTDLKMKVFEWAKSRWSVPSKLGRSTRLGGLVQQEMERAEQIAFGLRSSIKLLFPRGGASNKNALGNIAARCERAFWQHLEPSFHPLMQSFAKLDPDAPDDPELTATAAKAWRKRIRDLAREQFDLAVEDMDADSDALERQVRARTILNTIIRRKLS